MSSRSILVCCAIAIAGCGASPESPHAKDAGLVADAMGPPGIALQASTPILVGESFQVRVRLPIRRAGVDVRLVVSEVGVSPDAVCPPPLGGECIDLAVPLTTLSSTTNGTGTASFTVDVSPDVGEALWLQGIAITPRRAFLSDTMEVPVYGNLCEVDGSCDTDLPEGLTGIDSTLQPDDASQTLDCGFLRPRDVIDPNTAALRSVQVTHDETQGLWFVESLADGVVTEPRFAVDYDITSASPPALALPATTDLSQVEASLSSFLYTSQGRLGAGDVAAMVRWLDTDEPTHASVLDIPDLTGALEDAPETLGLLGEWRATCLAARALAAASASGDIASFAGDDRFFETLQQGESVADQCFWRSPAHEHCSGRYDPRDFVDTPFLHPVYASGDWGQIPVGVTLPPGLNAPYEIWSEPHYDNDWSLGGSYDATNHLWNHAAITDPVDTVLADHDRDPLIAQHIHTWEVLPGLRGDVDGESLLLAHAPAVDAVNRGCYEPGTTGASDANCTDTAPVQAEPGCVFNGVAYSFADCHIHPRRFARHREFVGANRLFNPEHHDQFDKSKLLVTTEAARCEEVEEDDDWMCVLLPSPMRIFYGGVDFGQNGEGGSIFRIRGFDEVEIEKVDLDVLPHPVLGLFEELDADPTLSSFDKLRHVLTTHVAIWQNVAEPPLNANLIWKYERIFEGTPFPTDANNDWDYDTAWSDLRQSLNLRQRVVATPNVFEVHDVDVLHIHDNTLRFAATEAGFSLRSIRSLIFERNWLEGQSMARMQDLGFPVDDPALGFAKVVARPPHVALDDIYAMGIGLMVDNNRNSTVAGQTPPGTDCCRDDIDGGYATIGTCDRDAPSYADEARNLTNYTGRASGSEVYCDRGAACDFRAGYVARNTIRNCTLENFVQVASSQPSDNHDGMLLLNLPGLVFSNELSNFAVTLDLQCDTAIDIANRRPCDLDYAGHHTRIERNIVSRAQVKVENSGEPTNDVTWANNLFRSVSIEDYHTKWRAAFLHNSYQGYRDPFTWLDHYIYSDANGTHNDWHRLPSTLFQHNLFRAAPQFVFLQFKNHTSAHAVSLQRNMLMGKPYVSFRNVSYRNTGFRTDIYDPPVTPGQPPSGPAACTYRQISRSGWQCFPNGGVMPEDQIIDAYTLTTQLGSKFTLSDGTVTYISPDGQTRSANPEDVLVAMHETSGVFEWLVSYEIAHNPSSACASNYEQRYTNTNEITPIGYASDNPACSFKGMWGDDALLASEETVVGSSIPNSSWCHNTNNPLDARLTRDLYETDRLTVGMPHDPQRLDLEPYVNPYASGPLGMGVAPATLACDAVTTLSEDTGSTVRQEVQEHLQSNLVPRMDGNDLGLRVTRDFCGVRRASSTTVGAFEQGSTCPAAFSRGQ